MLFKIMLLIGAFQGAVLLIPLLRYRNNRGPNRILAGLIALLVLDLLLAYLNNSGFVRTRPHLFNLNASLPFLFTPLIYFYISAITGKIRKFRPIYLLHALPFLAHLAFMSFTFYSLPGPAILRAIEDFLAGGRIIDRKMISPGSEGASLAFLAAMGAIALSYYAVMAKRVAEYRRDLADFYSDLKNKIYGLLVIVMSVSLAIWALVAFVIVSAAKYQVAPMILYAIGLYLATYKLVTAPEIFSGNCVMSALRAPAAGGARQGQERALEAFVAFVEEGKAYLDPELSIGDVCGRIGLPVHQVSKALNARLKMNFYRFINEYRVEEAKRALLDEGKPEKSILAIAMASGFNSKSTFNEVFKKSTGLTPSQFRDAPR
jgi:AraC-like DNA-binding protein